MPIGKAKWAEFLTNGENKNDLMMMYGEYLKTEEAHQIIGHLPITFCGGNNITHFDGILEPCNHEEADTKIPLLAVRSITNIVAVSQDCDVLVLLITAYALAKPNVRWQMKYDQDKLADIEAIVKNLGEEVS